MSFVVALTTIDSPDAARKIAETLVRERVIACVNILPSVESIYEWKGKVRHETEWLLVMKTREARVARLKERLPALHPYECPELVVLPISSGLEPYLAWIKDFTA